MNPVRPEELSALLDGELDAERAREVELQIAADPALRAEFEALSGSDAVWRAAAATAAFAPDVRMKVSASRVGWFAALATLLGVLIGLRIALKLMGSPAYGFGLSATSLALLLVAVVWLARTDPRNATRLNPGAAP